MKSLFLVLALFVGALSQTAWAEEQKEQWDPMDKEILAFALVEVEVEAKRPQHKDAAKKERVIIARQKLPLADPKSEVEAAQQPQPAGLIGKKTQ